MTAQFDTSVIITTFQRAQCPARDMQPKAQALNLAFDLLAAIASGYDWRDVLPALIQRHALDSETIQQLPEAMLRCRIASIRSCSKEALSTASLATFDFAVARIIEQAASFTEGQLARLIRAFAAQPDGDRLPAVDPLFGHLSRKVADGPSGPIFEALYEFRSLVVKAKVRDEALCERLGVLLCQSLPERRHRPSTLRIKLPEPKPGRASLPSCPRPSQKWLRQVNNLLSNLGEQRVREITKRVLRNFVLNIEQPANGNLRDYTWVAKQLCDDELIEILAEVANRCFQQPDDDESIKLGMAAVSALAEQNCKLSFQWLEWLAASVNCPLIRADVRRHYQHQFATIADY